MTSRNKLSHYSPSTSPPIESRKRILIVDDDPDITKTFSLTLEDSGEYDVQTYNDPLAALANFRPGYYDLILLDIRMPKMNGFELYDKMKTIDNKTKVCFISANNLEDRFVMEQFPTLQIECLLTKPIEVGALLKALEVQLLR
ncbi:MAG TPA: response regulator [Nitrososphaeraceae archaeon]|nr:response regulator [Nitrososphaeraceae archaeon]